MKRVKTFFFSIPRSLPAGIRTKRVFSVDEKRSAEETVPTSDGLGAESNSIPCIREVQVRARD